MGRVISIVGNSGVGKTTLARKLCELGGFAGAYEQLQERPFQELFSNDRRRYGLPNQIDFLTYRAEQEWAIRQNPKDGVIDGGLDLDYQVFTRLFYQKGFLTEAEFELCSRVYRLVRAILPPPDLIVRMSAPLPVLVERFTQRGRTLEITTLADLEVLQKLLDEWLETQSSARLLNIDTSTEGRDYVELSARLLEIIRSL